MVIIIISLSPMQELILPEKIKKDDNWYHATVAELLVKRRNACLPLSYTRG
jgi:hypothetical protein